MQTANMSKDSKRLTDHQDDINEVWMPAIDTIHETIEDMQAQLGYTYFVPSTSFTHSLFTAQHKLLSPIGGPNPRSKRLSLCGHSGKHPQQFRGNKGTPSTKKSCVLIYRQLKDLSPNGSHLLTTLSLDVWLMGEFNCVL